MVSEEFGREFDQSAAAPLQELSAEHIGVEPSRKVLENLPLDQLESIHALTSYLLRHGDRDFADKIINRKESMFGLSGSALAPYPLSFSAHGRAPSSMFLEMGLSKLYSQEQEFSGNLQSWLLQFAGENAGKFALGTEIQLSDLSLDLWEHQFGNCQFEIQLRLGDDCRHALLAEVNSGADKTVVLGSSGLTAEQFESDQFDLHFSEIFGMEFLTFCEPGEEDGKWLLTHALATGAEGRVESAKFKLREIQAKDRETAAEPAVESESELVLEFHAGSPEYDSLFEFFVRETLNLNVSAESLALAPRIQQQDDEALEDHTPRDEPLQLDAPNEYWSKRWPERRPECFSPDVYTRVEAELVELNAMLDSVPTTEDPSSVAPDHIAVACQFVDNLYALGDAQCEVSPPDAESCDRVELLGFIVESLLESNRKFLLEQGALLAFDGEHVQVVQVEASTVEEHKDGPVCVAVVEDSEERLLSQNAVGTILNNSIILLQAKTDELMLERQLAREKVQDEVMEANPILGLLRRDRASLDTRALLQIFRDITLAEEWLHIDQYRRVKSEFSSSSGEDTGFGPAEIMSAVFAEDKDVMVYQLAALGMMNNFDEQNYTPQQFLDLACETHAAMTLFLTAPTPEQQQFVLTEILELAMEMGGERMKPHEDLAAHQMAFSVVLNALAENLKMQNRMYGEASNEIKAPAS